MVRATTASILIVAAANGADAGEALLGAERLKPHGVEVSRTYFAGSDAIRLGHLADRGFALVQGAELGDGEISVDVAGTVDPDASAETRSVARGFIGIVFHVQRDAASYEKVFIRPTNARSDDQLRRNHTTQHASYPEYSWHRLRREYESYADVVPRTWTKLRLAIEGSSARLFVGNAEQPCLVVGDLKLGETSGGVGLWVGPGTIGYFRDLRLPPSDGRHP